MLPIITLQNKQTTQFHYINQPKQAPNQNKRTRKKREPAKAVKLILNIVIKSFFWKQNQNTQFNYNNKPKRAPKWNKWFCNQREPPKAMTFISIIVLTIIIPTAQPKHVI